MTDETKQPWTPGEWEMFGGRLIRSVHGGTTTPIAETRNPYRHGVGPVRAHEEDAANGKLMAAAPAMAKALAAFVITYDRHMSTGVRGTTVYVDPPEIAAARSELESIGWKWGKR